MVLLRQAVLHTWRRRARGIRVGLDKEVAAIACYLRREWRIQSRVSAVTCCPGTLKLLKKSRGKILPTFDADFPKQTLAGAGEGVAREASPFTV